MKASHFVAHLSGLIAAADKPPWYLLAAWGCITAGHVQFIAQRRSDDLYLVRMWLTPPKTSTDEGGKFESGGSVLLHWFACGDDDLALHDHPWSFATTVLAGGYWEHRPPLDWNREHHVNGPPWDQRRVWIGAGDEVVRGLHDLHCVTDPSPDTFTLVRTGARIRDWGFHPFGRPWVNHSVYLDRTAIAGAAHV